MSTFEYFGIQKVKEGKDKEDKDIPVEIAYDKALTWLLDRKKVDKSWTSVSSQCKKKLRAMVESEDLSTDEDFVADYAYVRLKMEEMLNDKSIDKSTGYLFGYNDERLASHDALIKAYEKGGAHMAELSQKVLQIVKYELPSQRKQVEKAQKLVAELSKREQDSLKESTAVKKKYDEQCVSLGIVANSEKSVADQLIDMVDVNLPEKFQNVINACEAKDKKSGLNLADALEFYAVFKGFTLRQGEDWEAETVCKVLKFVCDHGNATSWDLDKHLHPEKWADFDESELNTLLAQEQDDGGSGNDGAISINWDDGFNMDMGDDNGIELEDNNAPQIEWEIEVDEEGVDDEKAAAGENVTIDWIEMEEEGQDVVAGIAGPSLLEEAKTLSSETILSARWSRNLFLDDLVELRAALAVRIHERSQEQQSAIPSIDSQLRTSPKCPSRITKLLSITSGVEDLLKVVETVQSAAEDPSLIRLLEIKSSQRYVTRLAASLRQLLELSDHLKENSASAKRRREQTSSDIVKTIRPRMLKLRKEAVRLRKLLEGEIAKCLGGQRKVILTGAIQKIR